LSASSRFRRTFAECFSVEHPELSKLAKAESHGGFRYRSFLAQESLSDLAKPQIQEMAVRANAADLAKGSRQSTLIDAGHAAQICNPHERPYVCARDLLAMLNNVSIPLMARRCGSGLASVLPAHCGTPVEADVLSSARKELARFQ
jgi:hypothetical protein